MIVILAVLKLVMTLLTVITSMKLKMLKNKILVFLVLIKTIFCKLFKKNCWLHEKEIPLYFCHGNVQGKEQEWKGT